jgi:type I restriction enzyme R subunit
MRGRTDYVLTRPLGPGAEPIPLAILEAKRESLPPEHGLQQGGDYRLGHLHHVPFVFASNGHQFVEYDVEADHVSEACPMAGFPTPDDLLARWRTVRSLPEDTAAMAPLSVPYHGGRETLRYYQDAAVRAALEKIIFQRSAGAAPRVLLSLATGAGKTRLAAALLRRLFDAGLLGRALFLSDRTELRENSLTDFQGLFGTDAAVVGRGQPQKNARVLIATYQTLDQDRAGGPGVPGTFFQNHYPPGFFDVILIDECHRSAWGDWHQIIAAHPQAIQIGLTATPRQLRRLAAAHTDTAAVDAAADALARDERTLADNHEYFGPPVYAYPYLQGVEDGYLAPPDIEQYDLFLERQGTRAPQPERVRGVRREDLDGGKLTELLTGRRAVAEDVSLYNSGAALEQRLILPDRIEAMCAHLFDRLCATGENGDPRQKTIVFCASDHHADRVAITLNNLYSAWVKARPGVKKARKFAFKCMASSEGQRLIPDFRGRADSWFIATTKDLLSTGVDVPRVRNIVFFRYVHSPILFTQMVGRGTRIHGESGKLAFRLFDYTGATALFGQEFITLPPSSGEGGEGPPPPPPRPRIKATGVSVAVEEAGHFTVATVDGRTVRVTWQEYEDRLIARLLAAVPTLEKFRACWLEGESRHELLAALAAENLLPSAVQSRRAMHDFDLYDVLATAAYGVPARTRAQRAALVTDTARTAAPWLIRLPQPTATVIRAIARQFERGGTEALDSDQLFHTPEVEAAHGLAALRQGGEPSELLRLTRETLFRNDDVA